jgi:hypothetical protein
LTSGTADQRRLLYFIGDSESTLLKYISYSQQKLGVQSLFFLQGTAFAELSLNDPFMNKRFNTILGAQ